MRVAVVGWSPLDIGPALAADLAHAGHAVRFAVWPDQEGKLAPVRARGGLDLLGGTGETLSGAAGRAPVEAIGGPLAAAVAGAEAVLVDCHPPELEARLPALLPHLAPGQVVHLNSHGYWPLLRLRGHVAAAGKQDVLFTESTTPIMAAGLRDGVVEPHVLRRRLDVAALPGDRIGRALPALRRLYPEFRAAESPLQTGLESMNLLVHPGLALANVGAFDRAEAEGRGFSFYTRGNTRHAGVLTEALDAERLAVCRAYGVRQAGVLARLETLYGARGATFQEAVADCAFFQRLGDLPAGVWRRWLAVDVPHAVVPLVRLAEAAGLAAPRHRAVAEIVGALLGFDPWAEGLTLDHLGVAGLAPAEAARRLRGGPVP